MEELLYITHFISLWSFRLKKEYFKMFQVFKCLASLLLKFIIVCSKSNDRFTKP